MKNHVFDNILGHDAAKQGMLHAITTGRLHHALLFVGPDGVGKFTFAIRLTQILMCENSDTRAIDTLRACGTCRNCTRILKEQHPDLIIVAPEKQFITIDTIRALQQRLVYEPLEVKHRIVIIKDAHCMQEATANALLKTLEEPNTATIFILISGQRQRLLSTIVSRCMPVTFTGFEAEEIKDFLRSRHIDEKLSEKAVALANGSPGKALELAQSPSLEEIFEKLEEFLSSTTPADVIELAAEIGKKSEIVDDFLMALSLLFRDALITHTCETTRKKIHFPVSLSVARKASHHQIIKAIEHCESVRMALKGNVNATLAVENCLLNVGPLIWQAQKT